MGARHGTDTGALSCCTAFQRKRRSTTHVLHRPWHRGTGEAGGQDEVTFEWLAEQLRTFVDLNPDFEVPVERLATWLARLDDDEDDE